MGLTASKIQEHIVDAVDGEFKFRDGILRRGTKYDNVELAEEALPKMPRSSSHNNCWQHVKHLDRGYNYFKYDFEYSRDNCWLHDDTDTLAGNLAPASNKLIFYTRTGVTIKSEPKPTTKAFCKIKIQLWRQKIFKGKMAGKWQEFIKHFGYEHDDGKEGKLQAQKRFNDALLEKVWQDIWEQQDIYAYHNNYIPMYYNQW